MSDRYVIQIQNPAHALEVFVWDRIAKRVVVSYPYPELSIAAQQRAKARCQKYVNDNLKGEGQ